MNNANGPEHGRMSYRDAGVDIDAGNRLVDRIKPAVARTRRPEVLAGLGGFGGLFELPVDRYRQPVLVSGTDGVGTKLRLAIDSGRHDGIGIDLVAMCVNDVLVQGAEPLFFLDYYATGALQVEQATAVIEGIAEGCTRAGAALIGGETAEMPGMYEAGDYDLAGFCVGIAERDQLVTGATVQPGDSIIALASSGPHSNGYSLIRKVLANSGASLDDDLDGRPLLDWLLAPTRIYVKSVLPLLEKVPVRAMAHITGGGLLDNLPRVMPADTIAQLDAESWRWPTVFTWLQSHGRIAATEMLRTFNCGVGFVLFVAEQDTQASIDLLNQSGEQAWRIGRVEPGAGEPSVRIGTDA